MNQIRRLESDDAELAQVRSVVAGQQLPDYVVSYEIRSGDIEGDPVVWVVLRTADSEPRQADALIARARQMQALDDKLRQDILALDPVRFPYIRFEPVQGTIAH